MADVVNKVFQCDDLRHLSSTSLKYGHYPVVYGAVCGLLGLSLDAALASFMSGVVRTAVASAVRLDRLGPVEVSQKLCHGCQTPDEGHRSSKITWLDSIY